MPAIRVAVTLAVAALGLGCASPGFAPITTSNGPTTTGPRPAPIFAVEAPAVAAVGASVAITAWVQIYHNGPAEAMSAVPGSFTAQVDEGAMKVRVSGQVATTTEGPPPTSARVYLASAQDLAFRPRKAGTYTIEIAPENYVPTIGPLSVAGGLIGSSPAPAAAERRTIKIQ